MSVYVDNARLPRRVYLHRLIMDPPPGMHVDHVNGDKLDNRRLNLRCVTRSQNLQNRRGATRGNLSTGRRGVYIDRRDGSVYARLKVAGRLVDLGRFASVEDADAAVRAARATMMTHSSECR